MDLLAELQRENNMGLILITHDLGVVADVADKIAVMYAGRSWRTPPCTTSTRRPPTRTREGLLDSIPRVDQKGQELYADQGPAAEPARHAVGLRLPPPVPLPCRTSA